MWKKMLVRTASALGVAFMLTATGPDAAASDTARHPWINAQFSGQVDFERRSTVVPMDGVGAMYVCGGDSGLPCETSKPYWVVVIHDRYVDYEIAKIYNMGEKSAPEDVEIAGVVVRPGTQIEVEAVVEPIFSDYVIVREVTRAGIRMD